MSVTIAEQMEGFEQLVARCAKAWWFVPGIAVGVVKGNRCVYTHVYGKRDVEHGLPVTEQTLFEIGSITKSFTATALGMLVDEGKIGWDTPVHEYLPTFTLSDPALTAQVTLRDLLTHRTGMPRHDYAHFGSTASREELVYRLRHLPASAPFRSGFQYNNIQYIAAGWVLEQLTGIGWEEFVRTRFFAPLKMRTSTFLTHLSEQNAEVALGYEREEQGVRRCVPSRHFMVSAGPAGAISANIQDTCRWLAFQMQQGKAGKQELLTPATLQSLHAPAVVRPFFLGEYEEIVNPTYGMSWMQMAYRGHFWVGHTGSTSGFQAHLSFIPREKVGVVVLTNGSSDLLPFVLAFNVLDRLLGLPPAPWYQRLHNLSRKNMAERQAKEQAESTAPVTPTAELTTYAGEYHHPGYGHLVVRPTETAIQVDFHRITNTLHQRSDGGYEIVSPWNRRHSATLAFDAHGTPTIAIGFEPATAPIVFTQRTASPA